MSSVYVIIIVTFGLSLCFMENNDKMSHMYIICFFNGHPEYSGRPLKNYFHLEFAFLPQTWLFQIVI